MRDIRQISSAAVIIRCTWERGAIQAEALAELRRRGLWLSPEQRIQAGIDPEGWPCRRVAQDGQGNLI